MITLRTVLPAFIAAKPSLISDSFSLAEIQSSRCSLSAHVELDQPRHVDAEMVRAHRRALDLALAQEIEAVQFDLLAERNHADDGRGAAGRQHRERLLGGLLAAQHLERMMHAAAR